MFMFGDFSFLSPLNLFLIVSQSAGHLFQDFPVFYITCKALMKIRGESSISDTGYIFLPGNCVCTASAIIFISAHVVPASRKNSFHVHKREGSRYYKRAICKEGDFGGAHCSLKGQ